MVEYKYNSLGMEYKCKYKALSMTEYQYLYLIVH